MRDNLSCLRHAAGPDKRGEAKESGGGQTKPPLEDEGKEWWESLI